MTDREMMRRFADELSREARLAASRVSTRGSGMRALVDAAEASCLMQVSNALLRAMDADRIPSGRRIAASNRVEG